MHHCRILMQISFQKGAGIKMQKCLVGQMFFLNIGFYQQNIFYTFIKCLICGCNGK